MSTGGKWKIKDLWKALKNIVQAILAGELMWRMKIGRYFLHIVYIFFIFGMMIWMNLMIETTLNKVEKNKKTIRELEIIHSQKTYELVSLSRRTTVEAMLEKMGSEVREPQQPATRLAK